MPRPVCVKCSRPMNNGKVGAVVQFNAIVRNNGPYEQWSADLAECPECGASVVFRYADKPFWTSHGNGTADLRRADVIIEERPGR